MLCILDEGVAKKTLNKESLQRFKTTKVWARTLVTSFVNVGWCTYATTSVNKFMCLKDLRIHIDIYTTGPT